MSGGVAGSQNAMGHTQAEAVTGGDATTGTAGRRHRNRRVRVQEVASLLHTLGMLRQAPSQLLRQHLQLALQRAQFILETDQPILQANEPVIQPVLSRAHIRDYLVDRVLRLLVFTTDNKNNKQNTQRPPHTNPDSLIIVDPMKIDPIIATYIVINPLNNASRISSIVAKGETYVPIIRPL